MPRPIKKRAARRQRVEQDELESLLARARTVTAGRERHIMISAAAIVVIVAVLLGVYYYRSSTAEKIASLESEGYSQYYGMQEDIPVDEAQRARAALESFQRVGESPYALLYRANSLYALGNYPEAVAQLEAITREFPSEGRILPIAYYKLGMARMKAGDKEAALEAYNDLYNYSTGPFKDLALAEAARLLESMGRAEESAAKYQLLVKQFPGSPFYEEAREVVGVEELDVTPDEELPGIPGQPEAGEQAPE